MVDDGHRVGVVRAVARPSRARCRPPSCRTPAIPRKRVGRRGSKPSPFLPPEVEHRLARPASHQGPALVLHIVVVEQQHVVGRKSGEGQSVRWSSLCQVRTKMDGQTCRIHFLAKFRQAEQRRSGGLLLHNCAELCEGGARQRASPAGGAASFLRTLPASATRERSALAVGIFSWR